jgi:hypothetical protein
MKDKKKPSYPRVYLATDDWLDEMSERYGDEIYVLDGLNDCIVGVGSRCGQPEILIYDEEKIIQSLIDRQGMEEDEAIEFYEFNIKGSWVGPATPIFLTK